MLLFCYKCIIIDDDYVNNDNDDDYDYDNDEMMMYDYDSEDDYYYVDKNFILINVC